MWSMALKDRSETDELLILRILNARMKLTEIEKKNYLNKEKGFEGEVKFDLLTEKLSGERIILNDLLLKVNNSKFQIDTIVIFQETIDLCEVKNYERDYIYKNDRLYTLSEKEVPNPLDQLKRCESLFRQLLQNLGFKIPIEGWLVFINPEFTLYNAPQNQSIIFPTQINRFMKKLNSKPSKLNGMHKKLAEKLISLHQIESPNKQLLPHYEFDQLEKRISCASCHTLSTSVRGTKLICDECGAVENVESAVIRSVKEIKLLFPDLKITTTVIHEWCGVIDSKKTIRRILKENFNCVVKGKYCYYD
jgi:hypothetical protein